MNYIKLSLWVVILILVVIAAAYLSILPQEIRWVLFIISITYLVIQIIRRSSN